MHPMTMASTDWGFPSDLEDISGEVAIVGVGEADHTKASGRTSKEIGAQAILFALPILRHHDDRRLHARDHAEH